jgi:hypothetical protein
MNMAYFYQTALSWRTRQNILTYFGITNIVVIWRYMKPFVKLSIIKHLVRFRISLKLNVYIRELIFLSISSGKISTEYNKNVRKDNRKKSATLS